jgi:D-alanine-D-alanine ligase
MGTGMMKKLRVGVLFGGRSGEHEVALNSARSVLAKLSPEKYEVIPIGITRQGKWVCGDTVLASLFAGEVNQLTPVCLLPEPGNFWLYTREPSPAGWILKPFVELDIIIPVLHGTFGEDGTVQGFLELVDIAYVGAGVLGSSLGMDKAVFKDVMRANNIPVVNSIVVTRHDIETQMEKVLEQAEKISPYPLFVKPVNLGSSVGISKCRSRSDLIEGLLDAARYDRKVLVEHGINAREIEVSVLGNDHPEASVPGEIVPSDDFYSYRAKYIDGKSGLLIPAPIPDSLAEQLCTVAIRAFKAADCAGMARVDFLLDKDTGEFFLGEINTIPGFTNISMYAKLWEMGNVKGSGKLSYESLLDRLIDLAMERKRDRDLTTRDFAVTNEKALTKKEHKAK